MLLSLADRFALLSILPAEESYARIRQAWILRMSLAPTPDESNEFEIQQDVETGRITWNEKGSKYVLEIPIEDSTMTWVRELLRDLDKKKKMRDGLRPLWEKFIEEYQSSVT